MKKLLALLVATAAFSLLPLVSQAVCVANGTIPRVFVQSGLPTNIGVRSNGAATIFYNFRLPDISLIFHATFSS